MQTAFFIDGYNVFYGLLAGTPYKWLDLPSLLSAINHEQDPRSQVAEIHYFTSPVQPALATRGLQSKQAQDTYVRALKAYGVKVHWGRHRLDHRKAPRFVSRKVQASRQDQVDIWNLEEKETDVRIAIAMYRLAAKQRREDASEGRIQQIVLVSGDTDLAPALEAIREDFPHLRIGIIVPHHNGGERTPPGSLQNNANWMRRYISNEELEAHQFPDRVPTRKKPADKPSYW
ncbi:NYN domain-containing protein [Vreelandella nigrificans]|uniref:NYN domain-containing protein n=1 Tax=Vreelandella nigrificans TaxID=2042704 RepID=A0A2A4HH45_9GAMM|nr:NYN domain-containing protein [Halomonas nigrificans]PCF94100.1 NYN domain-containing protein [Halomonas nigrificans]